jgi:O-antigen ligase
VGVGFFRFQGYSLRNTEIRQSTAGLGYGTHNTYVEVLVEGGVLAFGGFMLHFLAYGRSLPAVWAAIDRRKDVLVGAIVAALIVVLVSAGAANILLHYLFWGVSGIALACLTRLRGTAQLSGQQRWDSKWEGGQAAFAHPRDAPGEIRTCCP